MFGISVNKQSIPMGALMISRRRASKHLRERLHTTYFYNTYGDGTFLIIVGVLNWVSKK